VQVNKHATESANATELKNKSNQARMLKSEIKQLEDAIDQKNKELVTTRFLTEAARKQFEND
jgi:hypothetical protein